MRSAAFGIIPDIARSFRPGIPLDIFRRMCLVTYFEQGIVRAVKEKFISKIVYLSTGQEAIPAAMSPLLSGFMVFAQHRCHAAYLAFGGNPVKLRDELLGLPAGTSRGRAGSNCVQCRQKGVMMVGHHGLIGENVPLGVGAALGSGKPVVCFFGDGAAEEDYVFSAMGFAVTHKLPVFFVCEDNNLSILTPRAVRRSWNMTKVAEAFGMPAAEISDDPWTIYEHTRELKLRLPAFINIHTCRKHWHNYIGVDGPPEWDRFQLVKDELKGLGLAAAAKKTESEVKAAMEKVWDRKLSLKLLKTRPEST